MALPHTFAPLVDPIPLAYLDDNFNYLAGQITSSSDMFVDLSAFCTLDGVTDDTAGFQAAIQSLGSGLPVTVVGVPNKTCFVAGTVYYPTGCEINLNGMTVLGNVTNNVFCSGYWSAGNVVSNSSFGVAGNQLVNVHIHNGTISTCSLALATYNCNDQCTFENIRVIFSRQVLYSKDCFYAIYRNITGRSPPSLAQGSQTVPAFWWTASGGSGYNDGLVERCTAAGGSSTPSDPLNWKWAFWLDGDVQHSTWLNCSAEAVLIGFQAKGELQGYQILGAYFEGVTTAFDMSINAPQHSALIDWSWMFNVTTAITATSWTNGVWGENNQTNGAAITIATNFSDKPTLRLPTDIVADSTTATLPAGTTVGDAVVVDYVKAIYDSGTGLVTNKAHLRGPVIPFFFSGGTGVPKSLTVPYCVISGTGTKTITIDTDMLFSSFDFFGYFFQVVDSVAGTKNCAGRVMGATVIQDSAGSLYTTFTIAAVATGAGKLQMTITSANNLTSVYGVVRHL